MFLFYCGTTTGRYLARDLEIQSSVYLVNRNRWSYKRGNATEAIINWGCGPQKLASGVAANAIVPNALILNRDISIVTSKVKAFERLQAADIKVPQFSRNWQDVAEHRYLARRDGLSGGAGIVVVEAGQAPPEGYEFYVRYIAKQHELRLHVVNGAVIHEQFKYIPAGSGVLIRNHTNGAVFSQHRLEERLSENVANVARSIACTAMQATGLFFGAVDLIITAKGNVYVLEINTAPGLSEESGTRQAYKAAFEIYLGGI